MNVDSLESSLSELREELKQMQSKLFLSESSRAEADLAGGNLKQEKLRLEEAFQFTSHDLLTKIDENGKLTSRVAFLEAQVATLIQKLANMTSNNSNEADKVIQDLIAQNSQLKLDLENQTPNFLISPGSSRSQGSGPSN